MKKHSNSFAALVVVLATLFSCTGELEKEELPIAMNDGVRELQAFIPSFEVGDAETRLDMNVEGNSIALTWSEEDRIGVFPNQGDQVSFAMSEGAGGSTATFSGGGWALKNNAIYYAYYPFNRECYAGEEMKNQVPCSFEGQVQTGANSLKHLGKYAYMYSSGSTPAEGKVTLDLQHLTTLLKLDLTSSIMAPATIKSVTLEVPEDETAFCLEGTIDLTKSTLTPTKTSSSITLVCGGDIQFTYSNSASVYLVLPPTDLSGKQISVRVETEEFGPMFAYFVPSQDWKTGRFYTKQLMAYYTGMPVMVSSHIEEIGEGYNGAHLEKYYDITYTLHVDKAYFHDTSITSVKFHIIQEQNGSIIADEEVLADKKNDYGEFTYTLKDVHIPFANVMDPINMVPVTSSYDIYVEACVVIDNGKEFSSTYYDTWSWTDYVLDPAFGGGEPEEF